MAATAPLPASLVNKLKARNQSVRFEVVLRETRQFRAYCCAVNSDVIMGVSKQPSVILTVTPNPVCLTNAISWDFTGSYAPGSTITTYSIDFGDGNDDTGASGTHTYLAIGDYTITGTVTEGTGLTQTVTQEVNVIACSTPLLLGYIYASTDGSGVYYFDEDIPAPVPPPP